MISHRSLPRRKPKIWKWILLIVVVILLYVFLAGRSLSLHKTIVVQKGDGFSKFTQDMGTLQKVKLKWYVKSHNIDLSKIQEGSYVFSGNYSFASFLAQIEKWPSQTYIRYTVLEGRSLYDIDENLVKKWYIKPGEYIAYVSSYGNISDLMQQFEFLRQFNVSSLEGFLYPDTYFVDADKPVIRQLVIQQLRNFEKKVRNSMSSQLINFKSKLDLNGMRLGIDMSPYQLLTLASVIEKEERATANKPTVAWIFLKRLSIGMRLDADITLCYGLKTGYETCTPALIAKSIDDTKNPYNTRQQRGLPPTPICSPTASSVESLLNFTATDYLFYLHDMNGQIHYGRTAAEHTANKNQYLK